MRTIHTTEDEIITSGIEVMNVLNPSTQIFAPFDFRKQLETTDENIVEFNQHLINQHLINQHLFENLWTEVGTRFNQSTALRVVVDSTYSIPIFERDKDFNLGLRHLKPYPNSAVLDKNSTLLREMLSEIDGLLTNEYDWDEIDYRKPTLEDINFAKDTLIKFVTVIGYYEEYSLTKPYISNSEDGGAKIEWHSDNSKRSLYLRIACHESVATKIWDESDETNIDNEPFLQENYLSLWKWIS